MVLDVGAGCGETALFFFLNGARKVICVEPNSNLVAYLRRNARLNHWNVEVLDVPFNLDMLSLKFDFMKMDGEGCEEELLKAEKLPPAAIEVHKRDVLKALTDRFHLNVSSQHDQLWIAHTADF